MKVVKYGIAMDFAFHAETELFCNFFPGNKKLLQKERNQNFPEHAKPPRNQNEIRNLANFLKPLSSDGAAPVKFGVRQSGKVE